MKRFLLLIMFFAIVGAALYLWKRADVPVGNAPPESYVAEDENGNTHIAATTTYVNTRLGFEITFPAGWYIPPANDDDPHAYSCAGYRCDKGALEIQRDDELAGRNFTTVLTEAKKMHPDTQEVVNIISGAKVLKFTASPYAEGWRYEYEIIFYPQKTGYVVFTHGQEVESEILPSFKLSR